MTDPVQLLRAANPIDDCDVPEFDVLLARLEREPVAPSGSRGRSVLPRRTEARHIARGRRALAALVSAAVAVAVATIAIVSLHDGRGAPGAAASPAYSPGQAAGRVAPHSMHQFTVAAGGARGQTWGAEWFRTTAGQVCVQAGRRVGGRLGYVGIDGALPADGRFHAWAPDIAVDARCIRQPARGGVALTVVERATDGGRQLPASGSCTAADSTPCPARETTTLYFGVLGSRAGIVAYGREGHPEESLPAGKGGADGEYIATFPGAVNDICSRRAPCVNPTDPSQLVHPGSRAFVIYTGNDHICLLRGPGIDGVMSAPCRYGLKVGRSRHTQQTR